MSVQRQLNALLFELQTAQSPLAQAKILARSWRTVRDLSPTDRRLLARHIGFEGAERILEGLANKEAGFAPAVLLQILNTARGTDGEEVHNLLAAIQDPSRRKEALSRGADLAAELLAESPQFEVSVPTDVDLEGAHKIEDVSPDAALAALNALKLTETPTHAGASGDPGPLAASTATDKRPGRGSTTVPDASGPERSGEEVAAKSVRSSPATTQQPRRPPAAGAAALEGWDRLSATGGGHRVPPTSENGRIGPAPRAGTPKFDAPEVFAVLGAESSSFSRLRALHREMKGLLGSSPATLRELLATFPDGWVRRRALAALIRAGVPSDPLQALELISGLNREIDRQWCLGALAERGDLKGNVLERSFGLVESPGVKRRLRTMAGD